LSGRDTGGEHIHFEGGVPVFETQLERIEREQAETKNRDKLYKDEQLEITRQQLRVNSWLMVFTLLLVITSCVASGISLYQARISRISATAAKDAVGVASRTLCETQASNARQAVLTERARASAEAAAKQSFAASLYNAHLDQRAWVVPNEDKERKNSGGGIYFDVIFTNTGKTPGVSSSRHPRGYERPWTNPQMGC
jgi:hypothetical protein